MKILLHKGIGINTRANGKKEYNSWVVYGLKLFGVVVFREKYYSNKETLSHYLHPIYRSWYSNEIDALNALNNSIEAEEKKNLEKVISYEEKIVS